MLNKLKADMHGYTVKKSKSMVGRDGIAWSCEIWKGNLKILEVHNDGNGGPTDMWYCKMPDEAKAFKDLAAVVCGEFDFEQDGSFAGLLADNHATIGKLTRKCKTHTLFQLKSDVVDGALYSIAKPYTEEVANQLRKQHGADLLCILNEQL